MTRLFSVFCVLPLLIASCQSRDNNDTQPQNFVLRKLNEGPLKDAFEPVAKTLQTDSLVRVDADQYFHHLLQLVTQQNARSLPEEVLTKQFDRLKDILYGHQLGGYKKSAGHLLKSFLHSFLKRVNSADFSKLAATTKLSLARFVTQGFKTAQVEVAGHFSKTLFTYLSAPGADGLHYFLSQRELEKGTFFKITNGVAELSLERNLLARSGSVISTFSQWSTTEGVPSGKLLVRARLNPSESTNVAVGIPDADVTFYREQLSVRGAAQSGEDTPGWQDPFELHRVSTFEEVVRPLSKAEPTPLSSRPELSLFDAGQHRWLSVETEEVEALQDLFSALQML